MTKAQHTIRIIAGSHRSRRIPVLDFEGLRPTGDRVRETLFNWLPVIGTRVLDACAGAGALGFEAASRGAERVDMVEKNRIIAKQLNENIKKFNFDGINVYCTSVQKYLLDSDKRYDLVFLDPPFSDDLMTELTELILSKVDNYGFIYREVDKSQELSNLPNNWYLFRQKIMGQVKIELWQKQTITEQSTEDIDNA